MPVNKMLVEDVTVKLLLVGVIHCNKQYAIDMAFEHFFIKT